MEPLHSLGIRRASSLATLLLGSFLLAGCASEEESAREKFTSAYSAIAAGDTEAAMELLGESIETSPTSYAYYQRARLLTDADKVDEALADCEAGLQLEPEHADLKWLQDELQKPADKRFKGRNANPPSFYK